MWRDEDGEPPPRTQKRDRPILSLRRDERSPSGCSTVEGAEQADPSGEMDPLQRFEAMLWADRNKWDLARRTLPQDADAWLRGGGFAGRGRLSRSQADKLLALAFAALGKGSMEND